MRKYLWMFILIVVSFPTALHAWENDYDSGELVAARTQSGELVTGECSMYSKDYGELEGAVTQSGETVTGKVYRYSEQYAEIEGAVTESGEPVYGACFFDE